MNAGNRLGYRCDHALPAVGRGCRLALACLAIALVQALFSAPALARAADDSAGEAAVPATQTYAARPSDGVPPEPRPTAPQAAPTIAAEPESEDPASSGFERDVPPPTPADAQSQAPAVRELSVPLETKPLLPEDRPAWVGAAPDLSTSTHRLFVGSYPTASPEDADAALDQPLVAAVNAYLDSDVLKNGTSLNLHLTPQFIRTHLIDPSSEYMAELSTSEGSMYQKWVVLTVTPEQRAQFESMLQAHEQEKRLVTLGVGVLGLVGLAGAANLLFTSLRRRSAGTEAALPPGTVSILPEGALPATPVAKRGGRGTIVVLAIGVVAAAGLLAGLRKFRQPHASRVVPGMVIYEQHSHRSAPRLHVTEMERVNSFPPAAPQAPLPPAPVEVEVIDWQSGHSSPKWGHEVYRDPAVTESYRAH